MPLDRIDSMMEMSLMMIMFGVRLVFSPMLYDRLYELEKGFEEKGLKM
jgi:hypothetical protein